MAFVIYQTLINLLKENKISDAERYLHTHTLNPDSPKENFELLAQSVHTKQISFIEKLFQKKLSSKAGNSAAQRFPVDLQDPDTGQTALHLAANSHNVAMVFFLLVETQAKAKQLPDTEGNFPLHLACLTEDILIVHLLLTTKPSVNVNEKNRAGETALGCLQEKQPITEERKKIIELLQQHTIVSEVSPVSIAYESLKKAAQENTIRPILLALINRDLRTLGNSDLLKSLYDTAVQNDSMHVFRLLHECTSHNTDWKEKEAAKHSSDAASNGALKILNWLYQQYPHFESIVVANFENANDVAKEFLFPRAIRFLSQRKESVHEIIQWGIKQALKSKTAAALFCDFCRAQATECYRAGNFQNGKLYLDALEKFRPFDSLAFRFDLLEKAQDWQEIYKLISCIFCTNNSWRRQFQLAENQLQKLLDRNDDFATNHLPKLIRDTQNHSLLTILARHEIQKNQDRAEVIIQEICQFYPKKNLLEMAVLLKAPVYFKTRVKSSSDIPEEIRTAIIMTTVVTDQLEIFRYLHEELNIPLDLSNTKTLELIDMAIKCNAFEIIAYIAAKGFRFDIACKGQLPLHTAAAIDSIHLLQDFIERLKMPIGVKDERGCTAMHYAAQGNAIVSLEYLESQNGLQANPENLTRLANRLVKGDSAAALRFLMARGFSVTFCLNKNGTTLFHFSANRDAIDILCLLHEELQMPLTTRDNQGASLMHYAVRGKAKKTRDYLVAKGAAFGVCDTQGNTPLHTASEAGDKETLEWYQSQNQLDIYVSNKKGETILDVAAEPVREFLFNITAAEYEKNKTLDERMAWISSTAEKSPQLKETCCEYLKKHSYQCYNESDFATGDIYLNTFEKISSDEGVAFRLELLRNIQSKDQHQLCLKTIADPQTSEAAKNNARELLIQNLICGNFILEDQCYAKFIALYEKHHSHYDKANLLKYALFHHLRAIQALQLLHEMKMEDHQLQHRIYGFLTSQSCPNTKDLTPNDFSEVAILVYSVFYNSGPIPDIYDTKLIDAIRVLAPESKTSTEQLLANSTLLEKTKRNATTAALDQREDPIKPARIDLDPDTAVSAPYPMQG